VTLAILGNALVLAFMMCCLVSAVLQILAWTRHSLEGVPITVKALWAPEGYFDDVGLQQIRLARRMLKIGGMAYLAYGALIIMSNVSAT
jgi:hypothetical protein